MKRYHRQPPPYQPWDSALDAALDDRRESPQDERVTRLVVAHNATVSVLEEFRQRYELLSEQERQRVDSYLADIYEILGIDPGNRWESGESFAGLMQLLLADVADHTVRIGRLEKLMEQLFTHLSTQDVQIFTHDSDTTTRHDIGMSNDIAQTPRQGVIRATSQQKFASDIKRREVRAYYAQYYPRQNQQQIADHFGISVRTLQRYLEDE